MRQGGYGPLTTAMPLLIKQLLSSEIKEESSILGWRKVSCHYGDIVLWTTVFPRRDWWANSTSWNHLKDRVTSPHVLLHHSVSWRTGLWWGFGKYVMIAEPHKDMLARMHQELIHSLILFHYLTLKFVHSFLRVMAYHYCTLFYHGTYQLIFFHLIPPF